MRIEHAALWARDLERLKDFYATYFEGYTGDRYLNSKTGFSSYFISFDGGARLEIMNKPGIGTADASLGQEAGYAHLAFSVGSREKVDQLTETLRGNGFRVVSEPRITGDGYYESCILDPEGNRVEITV